MGNRRCIFDGLDLQTGGGQGTDRRLPAGTGTFDANIYDFHPLVPGKLGGALSGLLGGKGSPLSRTPEP